MAAETTPMTSPPEEDNTVISVEVYMPTATCTSIGTLPFSPRVRVVYEVNH